MADDENTIMDKNTPLANPVEPPVAGITQRIDNQNNVDGKGAAGELRATTQYCEELQGWMWQYYSGYVTWQSWVAASAMSYPCYLQPDTGTTTLDINTQNWYNGPFGAPQSASQAAVTSRSGDAAVVAQPQQQENGNAQRPGKRCRLCADCRSSICMLQTTTRRCQVPTRHTATKTAEYCYC